MAKRFTDTDKWKREWFSELDNKGKLIWIYLLDQCDHRGVWFRNFKLISDQLGFKVTPEFFRDTFGDKIQFFDGDKYFIPSFVEFQYGELNPGNNAHKSVIELVERVKKLGANEDLISPSLGAQDKDTDKEKDLDRVKDKEIRIQIELIYSKHYPLKKGKSNGIDAAARDLKTEKDLVDFETAVVRYANECKVKGTHSEYIKHFSTFVSTWRDWLDPDAGTSTVTSILHKTKAHQVENNLATLWAQVEAEEKLAKGEA